ncbi:IclR family transcriptional regulator [Jongsikchunia kroppenstedtii]|uniref:IclR family transcriptional regulator n=1 Tax=Jongsikchunia kroppenstedtii TaxID=1121721 RepID=UPI000361CD20|nr:IclR family transcriptional regulator C-terminal domain-containing protein [Jongsikchunia kroppenstedtii]
MVDKQGAELPAGTLERAELVFTAIENRGTATFSEIVRLTGLPNSTAHRLLDRLVRLRWLARNERGYELGIRLFDLGSQAIRGHWFHRAALPALRELHHRTGLVVHLGFLDGDDTVYWEKVAGSIGAKVPTRVGGRYPAYRSAVGKAMLGRLSAEDMEDAITAAQHRETDTRFHKILRSELETSRGTHVAFDRAGSIPGLGCVAAPIDYPLPVPAAVSVCGPLASVASDRRLILSVQRSAAQITEQAHRHDPATLRGRPIAR